MFEEIGQSLEEGLLESIDEESLNLKAIQLRKRLIELRSQLSQYCKRLDVAKKNKTRWKSIVSEIDYEIDWNKVRDDRNDKENEKRFIELMVQAYECTTKILVQLGQIKEVNMTVNFIDDDYNYFKLKDFNLTADYVFLDKKAQERGGDYSLRLNQTKLKEIVRQQEKNNLDSAISAHFKNFIAPFVEYEAVSSTGWKPNKGVLGEAFERHLELVRHNTVVDYLMTTDFGSVGDRWQLYKQSSGSDPYFTGPDTGLSQVKNINASLISNANTVLNTLDGIITMTDEKAIIQKTKKVTDKIFKQAKTTDTIKQEVLLDLLEKCPKYVESIIQNLVARGQKYLKVSYVAGTNEKGKKIIRTKKIKINQGDFSLEMY